MGYMLSTQRKWDEGVSAIDAALEQDALFVPQVTPTILPNGQTDSTSFTVYRDMPNGDQYVLNAGVKAGYHAGSYQFLLETAEAMFPNSVVSLQDVGQR